MGSLRRDEHRASQKPEAEERVVDSFNDLYPWLTDL